MPEFSPVFSIGQIDGSTGFTIVGDQINQGFGLNVAGAGDINGDGFVDLVFGAPYTDIAAENDDRGRAYVIFGGLANLDLIDAADSSSDGVIQVAQLNGANGFRIDGVTDDDRLGISVDAAGDVDGDGIDDLLIGGGGNGRDGMAYLIFGRDTGFASTLSPEVTGNGSLSLVFEPVAENPLDELGFSVSSAGDINADGFDDILIGARTADPFSAVDNDSEGAAYLIYGGAANLDDLDDDDGLLNGFADLVNLSGNGAILSTVGELERVGAAVSELGDINGDGFDDFAVGAPNDDPNSADDNYGEGRLHVVLGRADNLPATRASGNETGFQGFNIDGSNAGDQLGRAVAGGGDVNGDGFDDFIIGAPYSDEDNANSVGVAYVIFGRQQFRREIQVDQLDGTDGFQLQGLRSSDFTGISVNILGDVNGDGFDDVGVGAHFFDTLGYGRTGAFFVVFGKAEGFEPVVDLGALDGDDGFAILGDEDNSQLGRYTGSALGDVNGDGFDDILVGDQTGRDLSDDPTGRAHIIFGQKAQGSVTRIGTDQDQTQNGGLGDDEIHGNDGNDRLIGHEGDDLIFGGAGIDTIEGGADADTMFGGSGSDRFFLSTGEDSIHGGSGTDTLDLMEFDTGQTLLLFENTFGSGEDTTNFISVEQVLGSMGGDSITGNARDNFLSGRAGDDVIRGGAGDDTLVGNSNKDTLFGGNGEDTFRYNNTSDSRTGINNRDVIRDFVQGEDVIRLLNIDANTTVGGNQAFTFIGLSAFSGAAGELRIARSVANDLTLVRGDTDGDGVQDIDIEVSGAPILTASDFIL